MAKATKPGGYVRLGQRGRGVYIAGMRFGLLSTLRFVALVSVAGLSAVGCRPGIDRTPITSPREDFFAPRELRLHPVFTRVTDWTGDDVPDGIEANLELLDYAGEPVKAGGVAVFELYAYDEQSPTARGERLANPWTGRLDTVGQQQAHWERTTRTYRFQLANPGISRERTYVLLASFRPVGQERLFAELILGGRAQSQTAPPPVPPVSPQTPPQSEAVQPPVIPDRSNPETVPAPATAPAGPSRANPANTPPATTPPADPWMFLPAEQEPAEQEQAQQEQAEPATQPAVPPATQPAAPPMPEVEFGK